MVMQDVLNRSFSDSFHSGSHPGADNSPSKKVAEKFTGALLKLTNARLKLKVMGLPFNIPRTKGSSRLEELSFAGRNIHWNTI